MADLRAYLAALANPLDDLALHSVLASPLAGVSLDALVISARRRGRGPVGAGGSGRGRRAARGAASAADAAPGCQRVRRRFAEERAVAPRMSLETLIDRAVTSTGYDRAGAGHARRRRRMANVRKLMRMAREFEAEEGRDLRGFIDFVAERDRSRRGEGEAPLEAEGLDAVRLMTVHRAKGLEFPVVCVADLGKAGPRGRRALQISDDGPGGLRWPRRRRVDGRARRWTGSSEEEEADGRGGGAADLLRGGDPCARSISCSAEPPTWRSAGARGPDGADALDLARPGSPDWPAPPPAGSGTETYEGREVRVALGGAASRRRSTNCCPPTMARRCPPAPEPPGATRSAAPGAGHGGGSRAWRSAG